MNKKKVRRSLDLEFMGSVAAVVLIVCAAAGFLDMERSPVFFMIVDGMGVLVNASMAALGFIRKRYVQTVALSILTVILLILLINQLVFVKGLL